MTLVQESPLPRSAYTNKKKAQAKRKIPKAKRCAVSTATGAKVVTLKQTCDRDSLTWLHHRGTLSRREYRAGCAYRNWFSRASVDGNVPIAATGSTVTEVHGGKSAGVLPAIVAEVEARQQLFWARWVVWSNQPDAIGIMDAVCGKGLSLNEISRDNDRIAARLETALKMALGQLATALERQRSNEGAHAKSA